MCQFQPSQRCFIISVADVTRIALIVMLSFNASNAAHIPRTNVTSGSVTSLPSLHNLTSLDLLNTTEKQYNNGKTPSNGIVTRIGLFLHSCWRQLHYSDRESAGFIYFYNCLLSEKEVIKQTKFCI